MNYLDSNKIAVIWGLSDRTVRDYCNKGRIPGAILDGKTWQIPSDAKKPERQRRHTVFDDALLDVLTREKETKLNGGIYHKLQVEMTYNSNHMEGSKLTHEQTRFIFETKTIGISSETINVDDIIEASNHFRCIDLAIDSAKTKLSESLIKQFHYILKSGTSDSSKSWFRVGDYKLIPNEVGGNETTAPKDVAKTMKELLKKYHSITTVTIEDIIEFHRQFECIHPFQDGNGRVGRLIMLKECLKNDIVPIIVTDEFKAFYYRGLKEWEHEKGYLVDTCLNGQDTMKKYLDYFHISYKK